ncbi:helix-turn-helix domain-containing protein [Taibaiella koreensis]|uniref:helix-turn-helix domain-containing protein n=1 Tax=Taibaiella koreensis TaxID=1268548 RepID=UPI000E599786|nr:helix-turn-helix transcriptional regulator [Taibaiella koreensis]
MIKLPDFLPTIGPEKAWSSLTAREKEVLRLIIDGYTNCEIAALLFVSTRTIDKHRQNLMLKLDARNTAVLVHYTIKKLFRLLPAS